MGKRQTPERILQVKCKKWFCENYPQYRDLFFKVHNESVYASNKFELGRAMYKGQLNKAEGVVAGIADILLLVPVFGDGRLIYSFAALEFKADQSARQSKAQADWENLVVTVGWADYQIIYDFDQFKIYIRDYLEEDPLEDRLAKDKSLCAWDSLSEKG